MEAAVGPNLRPERFTFVIRYRGCTHSEGHLEHLFRSSVYSVQMGYHHAVCFGRAKWSPVWSVEVYAGYKGLRDCFWLGLGRNEVLGEPRMFRVVGACHWMIRR